MRESESARRRRFNTLFASYSSDIVAYCGWRAASASDGSLSQLGMRRGLGLLLGVERRDLCARQPVGIGLLERLSLQERLRERVEPVAFPLE